jgi:hypothetical protein
LWADGNGHYHATQEERETATIDELLIRREPSRLSISMTDAKRRQELVPGPPVPQITDG